MDNILPTETFTEVDGDILEIWKDIPGWEGFYQASNLGRIKRLPLEFTYSDGQKHYYPEKIYVPAVAGNGYKMVTFRKPGEKQEHLYVHRLIAETFIKNPEGYNVINHLDSDRTNNNVNNLEWTTFSGNSIHAIHHHGKIGAITMRPVICTETGKIFESCTDAARYLSHLTTNLKSSGENIRMSALGRRPTALGFHWKFKENI